MIIYDIEIIKAIPPVDGNKIEGIAYAQDWQDFDNMGISCICAYDYIEDRYRIFLQDNFCEFQSLLNNRQVIIGFNNQLFDDKLLAANKLSLEGIRSYDLLVELWQGAGLGTTYNKETHSGFGLDRISELNTGKRKTGIGSSAAILWQQGQYGTVIDYCLQDVNLTKQLIDIVLDKGELIGPRGILSIKKPLYP
jgi:hypothetical protein